MKLGVIPSVIVLVSLLGACAPVSPPSVAPAASVTGGIPASPQECLTFFRRARAEQATIIHIYGPQASKEELARPKAVFQAILTDSCRALPSLWAASLTSIGVLDFWQGNFYAARDVLRLAQSRAAARFPLPDFVSMLEACDLSAEQRRLFQIRSMQMLGEAGRNAEKGIVLREIDLDGACPALRRYVQARRQELSASVVGYWGGV